MKIKTFIRCYTFLNFCQPMPWHCLPTQNYQNFFATEWPIIYRSIPWFYYPFSMSSISRYPRKNLNSFTPMSRSQRLMIYLPFTYTMSCLQQLFDLKVNKHLDTRTCHWFTCIWNVDLGDSHLALSSYTSGLWAWKYLWKSFMQVFH